MAERPMRAHIVRRHLLIPVGVRSPEELAVRPKNGRHTIERGTACPLVRRSDRDPTIFFVEQAGPSVAGADGRGACSAWKGKAKLPGILSGGGSGSFRSCRRDSNESRCRGLA